MLPRTLQQVASRGVRSLAKKAKKGKGQANPQAARRKEVQQALEHNQKRLLTWLSHADPEDVAPARVDQHSSEHELRHFPMLPSASLPPSLVKCFSSRAMPTLMLRSSMLRALNELRKVQVEGGAEGEVPMAASESFPFKVHLEESYLRKHERESLSTFAPLQLLHSHEDLAQHVLDFETDQDGFLKSGELTVFMDSPESRQKAMELLNNAKGLTQPLETAEAEAPAAWNKGEVVMIGGNAQCGKSVLMQYLVTWAQQQQWIVFHEPNTMRYQTEPSQMLEALDRPMVLYHDDVAISLLQRLLESNGALLQKVALKNKYDSTKDAAERVRSAREFEKEAIRSGAYDRSELSQSAQVTAAQLKQKLEFMELEDMHEAGEIDTDDFELRKRELGFVAEEPHLSLEEFKKKIDSDGNHGFDYDPETDEPKSLYDMLQFAVSDKCTCPSSLLYGVVQELKQCTEVPVMIALDDINFMLKASGDNLSPIGGLLDPLRLACVDALSRFMEPNALANGVTLLAYSRKGISHGHTGSIANINKFYEDFDLPLPRTVSLPPRYDEHEFDAHLAHLWTTGVYSTGCDFEQNAEPGAVLYVREAQNRQHEQTDEDRYVNYFTVEAESARVPGHVVSAAMLR